MINVFSRRNDNAKFTIISYFTFEKEYIDAVYRLLASLKALPLSYYIEGIPNLGSWKACTDYKARFIKRALSRVNTPVVFLDADATVECYPELFDTLSGMQVDIAAFINHINHLLSGTLYFANNANVKSLIDQWIEANDLNTVVFEQRILQTVLAKNKSIRFKTLPLGYCQVFDYVKQAEQIYIKHWQVSRCTKRKEAFTSEQVKQLIQAIDEYVLDSDQKVTRNMLTGICPICKQPKRNFMRTKRHGEVQSVCWRCSKKEKTNALEAAHFETLAKRNREKTT